MHHPSRYSNYSSPVKINPSIIDQSEEGGTVAEYREEEEDEEEEVLRRIWDHGRNHDVISRANLQANPD